MHQNVVSSLHKKNFTKSEVNCMLIQAFLKSHPSISVQLQNTVVFKQSIFFMLLTSTYLPS